MTGQDARNLLSTHLPLGTVVIMVLWAVGMGWWWSSQIELVRARIAALEIHALQVDRVDESRNSHEVRITILEQIAGRVRDDLAEIKDMLQGKRSGNAAPLRSPQQQ